MSFYDTVEGKRVLDLENQITRLSANIYAAEYQWLCLLAQFDELEGWCGNGIKSFAHWLNWKCGISLAAGREKVRVARRLGELPLISKAMSEGRLSYSKVRAITRIATAQNEQDLLYIAENGTAEHLEKTVRLYRQAKAAVVSDVDSIQANQQHEMKYLTYYYDIDGSLVINARVPAEQGAQLIKALEAGTDLLVAEQRRISAEASPKTVDPEEPIQQPPDVSAEAPPDIAKDVEASIDSARVSAEASPDIAKDVEASIDSARVSAEASRPPLSSIRVDALCMMAEGWLSHEPTAVSDGDRYQVVVHADEDALNGSTEANAEIERGPLIALETVRRLACDSSMVRVTEDASGNILDIGRKTRTIPSAIKRALRIRDQGCQFPGCTTDHRFCDGHHVQHWSRGGNTSLSNLVLLCRQHHRLVHEGGYTVEGTDQGSFIFHSPDGRALEFSTPLPDVRESNANALEVERSNRQLGLHIDENTCLTDWDGSQADYNHIVGGLM
jgi:hypothetical protein